jgi:hypothetical protein
MYKLTDAKKAVNNIDFIIKQSNYYLIDLVKTSINEDNDFNDKQIEKIEQVLFTIKDKIAENSLLNTIQDKKKRKKVNRKPSKYNLYIKDNIANVRENNPTLNNKEVLSEVAKLWQEHKKLNIGNEDDKDEDEDKDNEYDEEEDEEDKDDEDGKLST